jgi:hypothetical protein
MRILPYPTYRACICAGGLNSAAKGLVLAIGDEEDALSWMAVSSDSKGDRISRRLEAS